MGSVSSLVNLCVCRDGSVGCDSICKSLCSDVSLDATFVAPPPRAISLAVLRDGEHDDVSGSTVSASVSK